MDYVALLSFRSSQSAAERDGALMRRAVWQYPEGIRPIAEYWPAASAVQVVIWIAAYARPERRIGSVKAGPDASRSVT